MIDWDLWRSVEELGFTGSYAAAARRLQVDATTVKRRIETMERLLGRPLFKRQSGQLVPTPACRQALDEVRLAAKHLDLAQSKLAPALENRARRKMVITSLSFICDRLLSPAAGELKQDPKLRIELVGGDRNLDLVGDRTADMALRMGPGAKTGVSSWHIADLDYATYISQHAREADCPWATLDRANSHLAEVRLPEQRAGEEGVRFTTSSMTSLENLITAGAAKGMLPVFFADSNRDLVRLDDQPALSRSLWLIWRTDLVAEPDFGPIVSWLVQAVSKGARATEQSAVLLRKFEK